MRRALAVGASVLLLAGCASPTMPEPLTLAEVKQKMAEGQTEWWNSMFPGEPEPVVEPVEYTAGQAAVDKVMECMKEADLPDVQYSNGGFTVTSVEKAAQDAANRQYFICNAMYPPDPEHAGYLSEDELRWIFYYNRERLVPCLQLLGYPIVNLTTDYAGGYWVPYYEMGPLPTEDEWDMIDLRCPPSPVGPNWRPSR